MSPEHAREDTGAVAVSRKMIRERFNGIELADASRKVSASLPLLLLFACAVADGVQLPGTSLPVSSVALVLAVVIALFTPSVGIARPAWLPCLLVAVPVWLSATSALNGELDYRRLLSVAAWAAAALVLSAGRISLASAGRGLALGMCVSVAWAAVTLPASSYAGRLTGWFGDPNTAGLFIAVTLFLSFPFLPNRRTKLAVLVIGVGGLALTLSRTSLLAVAFAFAWMVLGGKINKYLGTVGLTALVYWVVNLPEDAVRFGPFADREGSDNLRERIKAGEELLVAQNPMIGNGAGTARVDVDGTPFFFHNSYLALRAEAGWVGLTIMLVLLFGVFLALISLPMHRRSVWMEGAVIVIAVCSANLGEVLLANPSALTLGFAGYHIAVQRKALADERELARMHTWQRKLAGGLVAGRLF